MGCIYSETPRKRKKNLCLLIFYCFEYKLILTSSTLLSTRHTHIKIFSLTQRKINLFSMYFIHSFTPFSPLYIYIFIHRNCLITSGWRLMRAGYRTYFHTLYYDIYIYIYIYIYINSICPTMFTFGIVPWEKVWIFLSPTAAVG